MNRSVFSGETPAIVSVIIAAILWGCIGVFVRRLTALGFAPFQITAIRCLETSFLIFLTILVVDRKSLRFRLADLKWFLANGLLSVCVFNTAYQASITMTSMHTAVVLLYTSPAFIMLFSVVFFHEKLTGRKLLSVFLCIAGSALVSGITEGFSGSVMGILLGLLSGLCYALYSIFSAVILKKYSALTNIFYTFLFAGIAGLLISGPADTLRVVTASADSLLWALLSGFVTGYAAYITYTWALTRMRASKAGIIATLEPVVAILLGVFLYKETLTVAGALGIALVFAAILLQNLPEKKH